jgi:hypothetical protein
MGQLPGRSSCLGHHLTTRPDQSAPLIGIILLPGDSSSPRPQIRLGCRTLNPCPKKWHDPRVFGPKFSFQHLESLVPFGLACAGPRPFCISSFIRQTTPIRVALRSDERVTDTPEPPHGDPPRRARDTRTNPPDPLSAGREGECLAMAPAGFKSPAGQDQGRTGNSRRHPSRLPGESLRAPIPEPARASDSRLNLRSRMR